MAAPTSFEFYGTKMPARETKEGWMISSAVPVNDDDAQSISDYLRVPPGTALRHYIVLVDDNGNPIEG